MIANPVVARAPDRVVLHVVADRSWPGPQMEEQRAGKHTELPDFIFSHFQKRVGIPSAVVEVTAPLGLRPPGAP